jgi:hypothetical protein
VLSGTVLASGSVESLWCVQLMLHLCRTHIKNIHVNIDGTSTKAFDSMFELITRCSSLDLLGFQGLSSHPIPSAKSTHSATPCWMPEDVSSIT